MAQPLSIVAICQLVVADPSCYPELVKTGKVRTMDRWLHLRGAGEYVLRVAEGDAAIDEAVLFRRGYEGCGGCPHRTKNPDEPLALGYCGPMLQSRVNEDPATCGCLIEGLTACASRDCPLNEPRWRRSARVELTVNGR